MGYYEVKDWIKKQNPKKSAKASLSGYGGIKKDNLKNMFRSMLLARRLELEEKLLLRKGLCKFVIGCGGKELIDVVTAGGGARLLLRQHAQLAFLRRAYCASRFQR